MAAPQKRLQNRLNELQQQFSASLPARADRISALLMALHERFDEERFQTLRTEVHQLAGSVTAFGFPALGDLIRKLEVDIKAGPDFFNSMSSPMLEQRCEQLKASTQAGEVWPG